MILLMWALLIFFIGFTCAVLLGRAFRESRESRAVKAEAVADKRQELEQILARHAAEKAKKDSDNQ